MVTSDVYMNTLVANMRHRRLSVDEAAEELRAIVSEPQAIENAVKRIREEGRRNQLLRVPGGLESLEYQGATEEARELRWYTGPDEGDECWSALRRALKEQGLGDEAIASVDQASTKIVAYLGDPGIEGLQKKGLVIGYIQSGKTSNFTAVIAKAADAGYQLFIVLSGMYNALRQQTQSRLNQHLAHRAEERWFPLTQENKDFGIVTHGAALLSQPDIRILVVVKKNATRLRRLENFLNAINVDIRRRCPALIIDDEADQATPNTAGDDLDRSRINSLIVDIRKLLPTSTYVGYTATPFANVFIDPTVPGDLYPSDFIITLPKPEGYFGPEAIFGRESLDDGDEPDDGYDMVRTIPDSEAEQLRSPTNPDDRATFEPPVTTSLDEAIRYFTLATAARRHRRQTSHHSSMLVHTTQFSAVHLRQRERIRDHLDKLRRLNASRDETFARDMSILWERELSAVDGHEFGSEPVSFNELAPHLAEVLRDIRVIADNSISDDRLDYSATRINSNGREEVVPQTVIAVGGNTLSRGLTLEGLVVSFFIRSGRAYDTLLQMGRWFGFRPRYEDLPRVWMTTELRRRFRFLATIEEEIRRDVHRYELEKTTPRGYGLKVRCHPDLLITAPQKMQHVETVSLSYSGERVQTFVFRHRDRYWLDENLAAARSLVAGALRSGAGTDSVSPGTTVLRQVHYERILDFLEAYHFYEGHAKLRRDLLRDYIRDRLEKADELEWWNVAVMGSGTRPHRVDGREVDLGTVDLSLQYEVPLINRAPLKDSPPDLADIKALMSKPDRVVDLPDVDSAQKQEAPELARPHDLGLLLLYPISKNSIPMSTAARRVGSRKPLEATQHILGVGIVFPVSRTGWEKEALTYNYDYVAVRLPDEDAAEEDDVDPARFDTEGDADIDPIEGLPRRGGD